MARFTYVYRSSDGVRHEEQITAGSRDEAFASLRERGIKPIKVIAADGSKANGEINGVKKRYVALVAVAAAAVAAGIAYWGGTRVGAGKPTEVVLTTEDGSVKIKASIAQPLARQEIPGSRARIEDIPSTLFKSPAEAFLARFAEPGRPLPDTSETPPESEFRAALAEPIYFASNELTEYIDLKRIVAGIKREMSAYLNGGGTLEAYIAELVKRQKMEIVYRDNAEKRLDAMLDSNKSAEDVYAYWLKANAQLQAMGIYPLVLPDSLRNYQLNMDFE